MSIGNIKIFPFDMLYPGRRVDEFQGIMLFRVEAFFNGHIKDPLNLPTLLRNAYSSFTIPLI
jgi:hypothetical protein